MSKRKWKKPKEHYNGYVYIIKIWCREQIIYKVGTTNRTVKTRMLEIGSELIDLLEHLPKMQIIRQKQTRDNYKVESAILNKTKQHIVSLGLGEWNGESELRKMNESDLLSIYDKCVAEDYAPTQKFKVEL